MVVFDKYFKMRGETTMSDVSKKIQFLIESSGHTRREVCEAAGIRYSTMSNYLNRYLDPDLSILEKVSNAILALNLSSKESR